VLAVGAGSGLTVNADDVALTTPGALSVATSSSAAGNHTHAITSSSNPGAAASILASSAAGLVQLVQVASNATFASGFAGSGYRVDYGVTEASKASAEFDNLTVRGRMRVYELLIQQIRATNGSVFVTSTGKAKAVTASSNPAWTVNGEALTLNGEAATLTTTLYTITTSDSTEDAGDKSLSHGFLVGDIIRAQQVEWNGSAFAGVIQSNLEVTGVANLYTFTAARVATGDSAAAVGYDYVRLGNATDATRQGSVYITSDDSNAPYIDVVDTVASHAQWNTAGKIKVRLGKLSGISDAYFGALSGYGLYSDNVYLRGSIYATDGVFSGTVNVTGGNAATTSYVDTGLGGKIGTGGAAADVNANVTTITGGKITTGTITAAHLNVSTLSAIAADMGSLTAGSIVIGSTNKLWLNDSADGGLAIGGSTKASAPFRVTAAGALTATSATITGAITASSGSITGFLTLGSDGGIYQGSGTAGSPTTGLKIWNDSGTGRIGGYNGGSLQWYASTGGYFYSGSGTMRIGADDLRLTMGTYDGDYDDYRTIKWVPSIDGTDSSRNNFDYRSDIVAYGASDSSKATLDLTTRVNAGDYDTREAWTQIAATNWNGTTTNRAELAVITKSSADSYQRIIRMTQDVLQIDLNSAPSGNPPTGYIFVWWESGATMKTKDAAGTTRSVTFA